jgi:hypothetical protein
MTTPFYSFVSTWSKTEAVATVPSTTAADVLGTQTAASLYYTYADAAAASATSRSGKSAASKLGYSLKKSVLVAMCLGYLASSLI